MALVNKCGQCAYPKHNGGICPATNTHPDPEQGACGHFTSELLQCKLCGNLVAPSAAVYEVKNGSGITITCQQCQSRRYTCATCSHGQECAFETDPSPLPKMIRKQIQNGHQIIVTDVQNPSRVAELCEKKCPCYDPEIGCLKQSNTCGNYAVLVE